MGLYSYLRYFPFTQFPLAYLYEQYNNGKSEVAQWGLLLGADAWTRMLFFA